MKRLNSKAYILLMIAGLISFIFMNGKWSIPAMAWIFPVIFLFITRKSGPVKGILSIAVITFIAGFIHSSGFLLLGFPLDNLVCGIMSLIIVAPFLVDRIFLPMFTENSSVGRKFAGTLIFPCAFATMEACMNFFPMGAFFTLSLSQVENLPFIQVASIFGQMGLSFLIAWFASTVYFVIDYLLESKEKPGADIILALKKPVCIVLAVFMAVFIYGGGRLILAQPDGDTVKIAMAQGPHVELVDGEYGDVSFKDCKAHARKAIEQAAAGGAELVLFNEEAFCISFDQEKIMKKIFSEEAKKNGMYIVAGMELYDPEEEIISDNKITCVDSDGNEMFDYTKTILVPVVEKGYYKEGDGNIHTVEMNLGGKKCNVSSVICYEGVFTRYMNRIPGGTDIHLNPSWEWEGLGDSHDHTIPLRGVENGFSTIKTTYESESIASDYMGRARVYFNPDYTGYDAVNFAYLPAEGVNTIYGAIGTPLDWIYAAGLIILAILAIRRKNSL